MITSNADEIAKELQKYAEVVERKLKALVAGFAGDIAQDAAMKTGIIDKDVLETEKWQGIYRDREATHGIEIRPGYHTGAWQYAEGELSFDPEIREDYQRRFAVDREARSQYKLGDTFLIGLIGPAATHAGPVLSTVEPLIVAAYGSNIKRYFDEG